MELCHQGGLVVDGKGMEARQSLGARTPFEAAIRNSHSPPSHPPAAITPGQSLGLLLSILFLLPLEMLL